VVWILFGSSLFTAFDKFTEGILKEFHLSFISSTTYLIISYLSIYFLWAIYIGYIANQIPKNVYDRYLLINKTTFILSNSPNLIEKRKLFKIKYFSLLLFLVLILALALFLKSDLLLASFYRTVLILIVWVLLSPILKWIFFKWLGRTKNIYSQNVSNILELIPILKSNIKPALNMAKNNVKGIAVYKEFIYNLIAMSIYEK
jgi:hypothetical protein